MRLDAGILTGTLLPAFLGACLAAPALPVRGQTPVPRDKRLPWEAALVLPPWQALEEGISGPPPPVPTPAAPRAMDLRASMARDGSLRILDRRGVVRLKLGLPGRVVHLWRDGGIEVDPATWVLPFASLTPLSRGVGELPWGAPDFRPGLEGLLWILDDSERTLSLIHPATGRVQYLALPPASEPELVFWPDHLELREHPRLEVSRQSPRRWSLPWPALLPQLLRLSQPTPGGRHGTAFLPFPKD